jgi:uncharacterized RDD family membrane protein YckC
VFFMAQVVLPMLVVLLLMLPTMMGHEFKTIDLDQAAILRDELWVIQRTVKLNWRKPDSPDVTLALARVRLSDLSEMGAARGLDGFSAAPGPALLTTGDRLWVIGSDAIAYYDKGSLTRLPGATRPGKASRPFVHEGRPAVIKLGTRPTLATLQTEGAHAEWTVQDLSLNLPAEAGALQALQAVEAGGSLYLFAQLCTESPEQCSLRYRELDRNEWLSLVDDLCSCASWTAISQASRPAVFVSEREEGRAIRLAIITLTPSGPRRREIEAEAPRRAWVRWRPFPTSSGLLLLAEGMPGSLGLLEVVDGRVTRSARRPGEFPFGANMMLFMMVPQLLPVVLSLLLALLLTIQMRRHRVHVYVLGAARRTFASLWQRALAQLVDLVPFAAGFLVPMVWVWQMFSDPEQLFEDGPGFPLKLFGFFIAGFLWSLVVFAAYSFLEGRFGKTPGKWLLGIRVLGTDLQPCGFWHAFLRNLLTLADGFFNFLVGALLVALTENWQRLGDLAARTIVVVDENPA